MKFGRKALAFLMISCIGFSMLSRLHTQASENDETIDDPGVKIGSVIYDYDEEGNVIERVVDAEGALTLEEAEQEYYQNFIGNGDISLMSNDTYKLISISENGTETEVNSFANYEDALSAYEAIIKQNPSVNYAVKSQDKYWKVKYATVKFKKIVVDNYVANTNYTEDGTGTSGYINMAYGIDAAFLEESNGKVKFRLSGVNGWVDASLVDIVPYTEKGTFINYYKVSNGKLYHYIRTGGLKSSDGSYSSAINMGYAPSYLNSSTVYYSYDAHYFYTDYFKMIDDYRNGTSTNAINVNNPYYNYYQYLPLHSQTNYTAAELNAFIASKYTEKPTSTSTSTLKANQSLLVNEGASFMKGQDFGVNPLMTMGIAINESGWGRSEIALAKNNLFGLNAVDSNPSGSASVYVSVESCIDIFVRQWVTWGYLDTNDWRYFGGHLGDKASGMNVKYASDPYWGEKAASHSYSIDDYLGKKDYQKYALGIKETVDSVNVRKTASTSSDTILSLKNPSSNVRNMPVIILSQTTGTSVNGNSVWYQIYTDHPLDSNQKKIARYNNESLSWIYSQKYDFNNSYGYISSAYIRKINDAKTTTSSDIQSFLNKASLSLSGSYVYGISAQTNIDTYKKRLESIDSSMKIEINTNGHSNSNSYIATDMILKITSSSGETASYTIIIKGDVNGDGKISSLDYVLVKNHILNLSHLSGGPSLGGDVNGDSKISSLDYVLIKNHILGISKIQ
ncbi:dockerin type I domain-containing protein [uncultured Traorella sp.]|uniref:dockerin type I domain-containing protein n=1 Tax=uncultured Traorella sp. TaxID=1929048 RepID=UPI0025EF4446|nr:dockerin type I domain-containing protein [uncultured Traorella sp.]